MKILFVGALGEGQTSRMRMETLLELGHTVIPLNSQSGWDQASRISRRLQQQFAAGPIVQKINSDLLKLAIENKPDLLWAEKQEYLYPKTLKELIRMGIKLLHFTPDPYFSVSWKRTRLMNACVPLFDYMLTSKRYELSEYRRICKNVIYMPLGFAEAVHRPLFPEDRKLKEKYRSDVAFIGGWEPRREDMLESVARESDCNLKIWGYGWDALIDGRWTLRRHMAMKRLAGDTPFKVKKNEILTKAIQGGEIYADAYAWAVSGARINIGFLRNTWPDQHTTRTFEIPACGSMLLADRTDEHVAFFTEGKEAEFFSNKEELIEKVKFYLRNEEVRKKIALNGYQKCRVAGYSYKYRLKAVLDRIGLRS